MEIFVLSFRPKVSHSIHLCEFATRISYVNSRKKQGHYPFAGRRLAYADAKKHMCAAIHACLPVKHFILSPLTQTGPALQTSHSRHLRCLDSATQEKPVCRVVAPESFALQDTGHFDMEQVEVIPEAAPQEHQLPSLVPAALQQQKATSSLHMKHILLQNVSRFRFHLTLNAPTAMVKSVNDIPITYLNKGQVYELSIVDTSGFDTYQPSTKYRTFVRVSFDEEKPRQVPSAYWGLWEKSRGANDAHEKSDKLVAIEYAEASQRAGFGHKCPQIEVESLTLDGFCILWSPGARRYPEVNLAIRFNFLSTDFTHSKGVKGTAVRLCAKTSLVSTYDCLKDADMCHEICYTRVKLFREHGAERKRLNDIACVKKSVSKLTQQLAQIESGKDVGRRKRTSGYVVGSDLPSVNYHKNKQTRSVSSPRSAASATSRRTLAEELQTKILTLQDMLTSTKPNSILSLRGEDFDDPDLCPVSLPNRESTKWQARCTKSSNTKSIPTHSLSTLSMTSQASDMWQNIDMATPKETFERLSCIERSGNVCTVSGWTESLGGDALYRPQLTEKIEKSKVCFYKSKVCFYVQLQDKTGHKASTFYRAIYLSKRTVEEFNNRIAGKWGIEPAKILRSIYVTPGGLEIEMDNAVIRELKDGQDMRLVIEKVIEKPSLAKCGWQTSMDKTRFGSDNIASPFRGFVLRLVF